MLGKINFDWRKIVLVVAENRFYCEGKPIFKPFKNLLKFHSPGLAPVEDESGWYHIKADGEQLYKNRYKRAFGFYCGRAAVTDKNSDCFHIGESGAPLYKNRYAWVGNFQENFCVVRDKNKNYFYINIDGGRAFEKKFIYAGDFKDGAACVKCADGLCRHIGTEGEFINGKSFLDLGVFHKNIASARDKNGWFHIDLDGNELYKARYLAVEPFYNGFALVTNFDFSKNIIDEEGKIILEI